VAWGVVGFLDERDSAMRAVAGGVVLGAVYLGLVRLCGLGSDWWTALTRLWPRRLRPEAPR
jgi:hypothetical protein